MPLRQGNRRSFLVVGAATAGSLLASAGSGLIKPARANGLAASSSMRGGANNYIPGAPIVERIGNGGFLMTGTVRRAGDGAPLLLKCCDRSNCGCEPIMLKNSCLIAG